MENPSFVHSEDIWTMNNWDFLYIVLVTRMKALRIMYKISVFALFKLDKLLMSQFENWIYVLAGTWQETISKHGMPEVPQCTFDLWSSLMYKETWDGSQKKTNFSNYQD